MLFRKNKIDQGIKDSAATVSGDFESLEKVQAKLKKSKITAKLFITPYQNFIAETLHKWNATVNYFKTNAFNLMRLAFFSLVLLCFIYTFVLLFIPFYGANVGDFFTSVTNFYTAAIINDKIVYSITPAAIGYIVVIIPSVAYISWYLYKESKTVNKLLIYTTKETRWISISIYILMLLVFIVTLILVLIPPNINALRSLQDATNNMAIINNGKNSTDALIQTQVVQAITNVFNIFGINPPAELADANVAYATKVSLFFNAYNAGDFLQPAIITNYSPVFNISTASAATLSISGIVIISFLSVAAAAIILALPCTILGLNIKHALQQEELDLSDKKPTTVVLSIFLFLKDVNWKISFNKKDKKPKKETFSKYRKQLRETGLAKGDETAFTSSQTDNAVVGVISQAEIEAHEANKAFLNPNGEWMYHDGQQNYFIAKNDVWIKYDINQAVHRYTVDKLNESSLSPTHKSAKKGLFGNKHNPLKTKGSNSEVALPDDDLDEILKKLDI